MADTKTTLTWLLRDEVSATAKKVNGQLDTMGLKAKGASGIMKDLSGSLGGLLTPTNLMAGGALALGGAIMTAVDAGLKEETSIAHLDTALKTNVGAWKGGQSAVDDWIVKTEYASAFAKGDLRDSLAILAGATHDVTKAERDVGIAMDLARFKGEDLATATQTITMIEAGRLRGLATLGIGITAGMTKEQALAAVEKETAGQMQIYADSHNAALDRLKHGWDDFVANVGGQVLSLADKFNSLPPDVQKLDHQFAATTHSAAVFVDTTDDAFTRRLDPTIRGTTALVADLNDQFIGAAKYENAMTTWLASRGQLPGQKAETKKGAPSKGKTGSGTQARASGGPVDEGQTYTVGEGGRAERLTMFAGGGGYVTPLGGSSGGFRIVGVSEAQLVAMVERGLYFKLSRSSPSPGRS